MKNFLKQITPPILFSTIKRLFSKPTLFTPVWNTLSYEPMKGMKMFFDPKGLWQKNILNGSYDNFLFDRVKSIQPEGKTVLDVGAHVGFHTLYFARLVGPKGKVIAFEPHPKNVERIKSQLQKNTDVASRIQLFDLALSDKIGTEEFTLNMDIESGRSSGGFIESADTIWDKEVFKHRGFVKHQVKVSTLDTIIGSTKPDILKIDVEGAESLVLEGARNTIAKYKPVILLEVHSMLNMYKVVTFFSEAHYSIEILKEESDGRCFIEAIPKP